MIYHATCARCGMDRKFEWDADPPNPLDRICIAAELNCPRVPRICGTLTLERIKDGGISQGESRTGGA